MTHNDWNLILVWQKPSLKAVKIVCTTSQTEFTTLHLILAITFVALVSVTVTATIISSCQQKDKEITQIEQGQPRCESGRSTDQEKKSLLKCLCILTSLSNLNKRHPNSFKALDGIRFITALAVVSHHTFAIIKQISPFDPFFSQPPSDFLRSFFYVPVCDVDTFFFVTALLCSQSILNRLSKEKGEYNVIGLIVNRFFRLTPSLCFAILSTLLLPFLGSGAFWDMVISEQEKCADAPSLLKSIFLINNIDNGRSSYEMCFINSWYLSADFQLYLCALPLLAIIFWWVFDYSFSSLTKQKLQAQCDWHSRDDRTFSHILNHTSSIDLCIRMASRNIIPQSVSL